MAEQTFSLPSIYSDGMVLQRNKKIRLHGRDKPGQSIRLLFQSQVFETKTTDQGKWTIELGSYEAGGPYTMTVDGSQMRIIHDIYIGEVWLLGGQSNMELPINRTYDEFKEEIDASDFPLIRQFQVPMTHHFIEPQDELMGGKWLSATPSSIQEFSSLGFFYAKRLYEELNVPIGLVHTAVGGTPIEAWMSEDSLLKIGGYEEELSYWRNPMNVASDSKKDQERIGKWHEELTKADIGFQEEWFIKELDTSSWKSLTIPIMFKDTELHDFSGAVWFTKTFHLSEEDLNGNHYRLRLGTVINGDITYLNGKKVGETGYRYPPRKYPVSKSLLQIGENRLTVRLSIEANNGGFIPSFPYQLEKENGNLSLEGEWHYKIGNKKQPLSPMLFLQYKPRGLYNGMLCPLKSYRFNGMLYYQGESNTQNPDRYSLKMEYMVRDWRTLFEDETLPFYYVQLAGYVDPAATKTTSRQHWAELREEQNKAQERIPRAQMVPAIDVGMKYELHPPDKKTLAERLSKISLKEVYCVEQDISYPKIVDVALCLKDAQVDNSKKVLRLYIEGVSQKLTIKGEGEPLIEVYKEEEGWIPVLEYDVQVDSIDIPVSTLPNEEAIKGVRYAFFDDPEAVFYDPDKQLPIPPFIKEWT
jgi:sialate O-acetylesterase